MPRVPTYDGPQVRQAPLQTPFQRVQDVSADERAIASAAAGFADAAMQRQQRDDQDTAFSTEAKLKTEWMDYESKLREARKGRDAHSYDAEVEQWWKDASERYGKDLSPGAQRLVSRSLTTSQLQAVAGAKAYKEQQLNASAAASYQSAQAVSVNEAATVGNETAVLKALADMRTKRTERAASQGWTPEQTKADELAWSSTLHSVMVQKLMRADPAAAQTYYDKYKGDIGAEQQARIESDLQQTSAAIDGGKAAADIWQTMGPKRDGQPVEVDKMEQAARDRFKGDPVRQKSTIADIQQRAAAHNAAERERVAGNVNGVMDAYAKGTPLVRLQTMPQFMALPGPERARIQEHIADRNHMLYARSIEDRARIEREMQMKAYPDYLTYSDPEKLATMTRAQVQALLPQLGNDLTGHLVTKWDSLQKKEAKLEAKMDSDDFNHVAEQMGLHPFDPTKTEDQRRQLGELKYRVEQMVDRAQQAKKGPLTRAEKMELMTGEMARTVTVDGFWSRPKDVAVIQLSADQLRDVVVPDADRTRIAEKMRTRYAANPDPLFAPTEENLRRWYLASKSASAALLPAEK